MATAKKVTKSKTAKQVRALFTDAQFNRLDSMCHDHFGEAAYEIMEMTGGNSIKQAEAIEICFAGGAFDYRLKESPEIEAIVGGLNWDELKLLGKQIFPHKSYS